VEWLRAVRRVSFGAPKSAGTGTSDFLKVPRERFDSFTSSQHSQARFSSHYLTFSTLTSLLVF